MIKSYNNSDEPQTPRTVQAAFGCATVPLGVVPADGGCQFGCGAQKTIEDWFRQQSVLLDRRWTFDELNFAHTICHRLKWPSWKPSAEQLERMRHMLDRFHSECCAGHIGGGSHE